MKKSKFKMTDKNNKKIFHFDIYIFHYLRWLSFSILIFTFSIIAFPKNADASLLSNAPNYLGLTDGLVGSWSFDGKDMNATQARDTSGNGNHGTLTNGPTRTEGKIGQALNFDGVNDYVDISSLAVTGGEYTFAAWIKDDFQFNSFLVDIYNSGDGNARLIISTTGGNWGGNNRAISIVNGAANPNLGSVNSIPSGWAHIAVTLSASGNLSKGYVNGIETGTATFTDLIGIRAKIATRDSASGNFWNGSLDEVRVYNRALSAEEIKRLYNIGATLKVNKPLASGNLQQGLVGSWSFDAPDLAGVTAYDRSGNANNGTLTNGPVRTIGKIGQALNFDGVDDYVNVGSAAVLDDMAPMSLSIWAKANTHGSNGYSMLFSKNGDFDFGWYWTTTAGGNMLDFVVIYSTTNLIVDTSFGSSNLAVWNHWVLTWDGSTSASNVHIYKNGVETSYSTQQSGVGSRISDAAHSIIIGNNDSNAHRTFDGLIDEVRVYNRALSTDEIKRLYKIGATTKINVPRKDTMKDGLVGYWTFDGPDMAVNTAFDRSGNANSGTLTNGPTRQIGKIGQALNFDGVNDYVNAGTGVSLNVGNVLTVSAWVFPLSLSGRPSIYSTRSGGAAGAFDVEIGTGNGGSGRVVVTTPGVYNAETSNGTLVLNQWQHIVYTKNGTGAGAQKIYVNGVLKTLLTDNVVTFIDNSDYKRIGLGSNNAVNGLIDEVRIYNRALSAGEILRLYNMGK